jgi:hypothetical protein
MISKERERGEGFQDLHHVTIKEKKLLPPC